MASTIGLDIAKRVFQAHGADATGRVVFRKRLMRAKVFVVGFIAGVLEQLVSDLLDKATAQPLGAPSNPATATR
jgi:hypothetical protein